MQYCNLFHLKQVHDEIDHEGGSAQSYFPSSHKTAQIDHVDSQETVAHPETVAREITQRAFTYSASRANLSESRPITPEIVKSSPAQSSKASFLQNSETLASSLEVSSSPIKPVKTSPMTASEVIGYEENDNNDKGEHGDTPPSQVRVHRDRTAAPGSFAPPVFNYSGPPSVLVTAPSLPQLETSGPQMPQRFDSVSKSASVSLAPAFDPWINIPGSTQNTDLPAKRPQWHMLHFLICYFFLI